MVANILAGSKRESLLRMKLDKMSTYGLLKDWSRHEITDLIDELIYREDLILHSFKDYHELAITTGAAEIIRGQKDVIWRRPIREKKKVLMTKSIIFDPTLSESDNRLF